MQYVQWLALLLSVVGSLMINYKKQYGFYVYLISNALMVYMFVRLQNVAQSIQFIFFIVLNIHGIIKWRDKANG